MTDKNQSDRNNKLYFENYTLKYQELKKFKTSEVYTRVYKTKKTTTDQKLIR